MPKAAELTGQGNPRPMNNKYARHWDMGSGSQSFFDKIFPCHPSNLPLLRMEKLALSQFSLEVCILKNCYNRSYF